MDMSRMPVMNTAASQLQINTIKRIVRNKWGYMTVKQAELLLSEIMNFKFKFRKLLYQDAAETIYELMNGGDHKKHGD